MRSLFPADARTTHVRPRRDRRAALTLQTLEGRTLMAAAVFNPTFGTLHIDMNAMSGNQVVVNADAAGKVTINGRTSGIVLSTGPAMTNLSASLVKFISVSGTKYADTIDLSAVNAAKFPAMAGQPNSADLLGQSGNDTLIGSQFNDHIVGADGNDVLRGNAGNDDMEGNLGVDSLYGGAGNDRLNGGNDGNVDYLEGDSGTDLFIPEWYMVANKPKNRDQPVDINGGEGDHVQGM